MKKIVLACGAGAATSTLVAQKVATLLDANGYAGKYEIVQCAISEAKDYCDEGADLLIATTVAPEGLTCPYVSGVPFMTGMNRVAAEKAVLDRPGRRPGDRGAVLDDDGPARHRDPRFVL